MNDILKYVFHRNSFVFIVQDHGFKHTNGSLDWSLLYKDSLHLVKQGNIKLAKSVLSMLTAWNNLSINSSPIIKTLYSDVSKQFVPVTISFSFKEDDFPSLLDVFQPITKSVNNSSYVTARNVHIIKRM